MALSSSSLAFLDPPAWSPIVFFCLASLRKLARVCSNSGTERSSSWSSSLFVCLFFVFFLFFFKNTKYLPIVFTFHACNFSYFIHERVGQFIQYFQVTVRIFDSMSYQDTN